jgi:hypothetical protein
MAPTRNTKGNSSPESSATYPSSVKIPAPIITTGPSETAPVKLKLFFYNYSSDKIFYTFFLMSLLLDFIILFHFSELKLFDQISIRVIFIDCVISASFCRL